MRPSPTTSHLDHLPLSAKLMMAPRESETPGDWDWGRTGMQLMAGDFCVVLVSVGDGGKKRD